MTTGGRIIFSVNQVGGVLKDIDPSMLKIIDQTLTDMEKEIDGLRASASLPYVSQIVEFRGKKLLDGGCSDRIPLKAFEKLGFDRNIVISTQPREHKVKDRGCVPGETFLQKVPPSSVKRLPIPL